MKAMTKEMIWYGRKGIRSLEVMAQWKAPEVRSESGQEEGVGGEEGHPDRTTAAAELVVRVETVVRGDGVYLEGVKGGPGRTRGRKEERRLQGGCVQSLRQSTSFTPEVLDSLS